MKPCFQVDIIGLITEQTVDHKFLIPSCNGYGCPVQVSRGFKTFAIACDGVFSNLWDVTGADRKAYGYVKS